LPLTPKIFRTGYLTVPQWGSSYLDQTESVAAYLDFV
jgi:hypothetical protein